MSRPRVPLCAALLLLAAVADADPRVDNVFRVWDADGNGILTKGEIPDEALFAKVDADGDGKVTRVEVGRYFGVELEPAGKKKGAGEKKDEAPPSAALREPRTVPERVEAFFRRFDADGDRKIQREEFRGDAGVFERYDRSRRDGALDEREVRRYVHEMLEEAKKRPRRDNFFELFDLNRDKRVTKREYDGPPRFFRNHDHDRDRVVTEGELSLGPMGAQARRGGQAGGDGPTRAPRRGLLERHDEDGDRRITLEELGGAEVLFRRLDKNRDGILSGSEVR